MDHRGIKPPDRVGLIGIGLLGSAIAERLLQAGFQLIGYDLDERRRHEFEALGGHAVSSPQAVVTADGVSTIVLCLLNSQVVTDVLQQIEDDLAGGDTIIDTTTGTPEVTETLANRLAERQIAWLDATVGGSSQQLRDREAILTVGGDEDAFTAHHELFAALAEQVFHVGPAGNGSRMKLIINLAIGLHRAVLAEALALARGFGFDLSRTLEVLLASPGASKAMEVKGQRMIQADFTNPQARLSQHLKDVEIIRQIGQQLNQTLPLSDLHQQLLKSLEDQGYGEEDNSAILRAWDRPDR